MLRKQTIKNEYAPLPTQDDLFGTTDLDEQPSTQTNKVNITPETIIRVKDYFKQQKPVPQKISLLYFCSTTYIDQAACNYDYLLTLAQSTLQEYVILYAFLASGGNDALKDGALSAMGYPNNQAEVTASLKTLIKTHFSNDKELLPRLHKATCQLVAGTRMNKINRFKELQSALSEIDVINSSTKISLGNIKSSF